MLWKEDDTAEEGLTNNDKLSGYKKKMTLELQCNIGGVN